MIDRIAIRLDGNLLFDTRFDHSISFSFVLKCKYFNVSFKRLINSHVSTTYGNGFHRSRFAANRLGGYNLAFGRNTFL